MPENVVISSQEIKAKPTQKTEKSQIQTQNIEKKDDQAAQLHPQQEIYGSLTIIGKKQKNYFSNKSTDGGDDIQTQTVDFDNKDKN